MIKPNLKLNLISVKDYAPFALAILCTASLRFMKQEYLVLSVFLVTLVVYVVRKYDSRILIGFAIILLMSTAVVLVMGLESHAENIAILAYYFLVIGVIAQFIEYLREGNEDSKKD